MAIRKNLQLGLSAIGLSLLALNLTLPATAADIVIDESGDAGGAGPDGAARSSEKACVPRSDPPRGSIGSGYAADLFNPGQSLRPQVSS